MAKQLEEGFLTKLYDFWSPHIDEEQFHFYHNLVKNAKGPSLELACGSGRILLPLVKEGADLDGVESSKELIDLLKKKAEALKITPSIYHRRLEDLDIKKQYRLIFVTLGSLQLMPNLGDVKVLLKQLKRMLTESGELSISLFMPWMGRQFESNRWVIVSDFTDKETKMRYIRREKTTHDVVEQRIEGLVRYEVWKGRDLLELHEKPLFVRWYGRREFEYMLKEAGFRKVHFQQSYQNSREKVPGLMLFRAEI